MWTYQYVDRKDILHYGVTGMKWGVRRYQNKDGGLTAAGKKRLLKDLAKSTKDDNMKTFSKKSKKNKLLNKAGTELAAINKRLHEAENEEMHGAYEFSKNKNAPSLIEKEYAGYVKDVKETKDISDYYKEMSIKNAKFELDEARKGKVRVGDDLFNRAFDKYRKSDAYTRLKTSPKEVEEERIKFVKKTVSDMLGDMGADTIKVGGSDVKYKDVLAKALELNMLDKQYKK